jgi:GxxExxY protein
MNYEGKRQTFAKEGDQLMGAAFEVHNVLGGGMAEEIYQQSLEIELQLQKIPFVSKQESRVFYKNNELHKRYVPDLVVCKGIVVELKVQSKLITEHEGQVMNYMRISRSPIGCLINFGPMGKLDYKRFILSELLSSEPEQ